MDEPKDAKNRKRRCPACQESELVPILYGPLPDSLGADRDRGAFFWGGLVMKPDSPRWKCGHCQTSFPKGAV
jgi:ribosomal protein S27AE